MLSLGAMRLIFRNYNKICRKVAPESPDGLARAGAGARPRAGMQPSLSGSRKSAIVRPQAQIFI